MQTEGLPNRSPLSGRIDSLAARLQQRLSHIHSKRARGPANVKAGTAAEEARPIRDQLVLSSTSVVRPEKVIQARRRIAEGYYGKPDVTEALSLALFESMGLDDD